MGFFSKKGKNSYESYGEEIFEENYTLSDEGIIPVGKRQDINHSPYALTPDEVRGRDTIQPVEDIPMQSAGESLYQRMMSARKNDGINTEEAEVRSEQVKEQAESLLSKCSQFVNDDKDQSILTSQPAYTLDSVEDIIAEAEKRAQERISKMYGTHSTAAKTEDSKPLQEIHTEKAPPVKEISPPSESPDQSVITAEENVDKDIRLPEEIKLTAEPEEIIMVREPEVKNYQYRFADEDVELQPEETELAEEKTIAFQPIKTASFADEIKASLEMGAELPEYEEELQNAEDEVFGDYETVADAAGIRKELKEKRAKLNLRFVFTLIFAAVSTCMSLPFFADTREAYLSFFLIAETVITLITAIINLDIFASLSSLFGKKPNSDLPLALCTISSLIFGIVCIVGEMQHLMQFGFIAIIGMLFSLSAKKTNIKVMLKNLDKIATGDEKYALTLIDETNGSYAIAHDAVEGDAMIAAGRKTVNITHFLKNSVSEDPFAKYSLILSIIGIFFAIGMAVFGMVTSDIYTSIGMLCAFFCICAPFTSSIISTLPLKAAAKRLSRYGAMITGFGAAEDIEPVNAVVLDINNIFPRGTVKMFDMKVLSPNNLEQTIFNAAAVTTSIKSPLGHVFRRIARTSDDYVLPPADSVKYENRLGISGWVGDHSLLIGNRTLMETHGVIVPSVEVDKKILRNGYFPVYVASDGRPCALLIVGYENRDDITEELHRLCNAGVTLLIDNCDSNVNEEMLCDYFGLHPDFVKIMQSGSVRKYHEKTEFSESVSAKASYDGSACGLASIVTASIRIKRLTAAMTVLHIICMIVGLAAGVALAVAGNTALFTPLNLLLYLLASAILVCIASVFLKP